MNGISTEKTATCANGKCRCVLTQDKNVVTTRTGEQCCGNACKRAVERNGKSAPPLSFSENTIPGW